MTKDMKLPDFLWNPHRDDVPGVTAADETAGPWNMVPLEFHLYMFHILILQRLSPPFSLKSPVKLEGQEHNRVMSKTKAGRSKTQQKCDVFACSLQYSQWTWSSLFVFLAGLCVVFEENETKISSHREKSKEKSGKTDALGRNNKAMFFDWIEGKMQRFRYYWAKRKNDLKYDIEGSVLSLSIGMEICDSILQEHWLTIRLVIVLSHE